jgi:protein phosphatase
MWQYRRVLITVPDPSLILLIGASGSGKSTFAQLHFSETEIVSSDRCRALVCDDEADQSATPQAFLLLKTLVRLRLRRGRLTVVDATNVQAKARGRLLPLAWQSGIPAVAMVFRVGERVCQDRNACRPGRVVVSDVIEQQLRDLDAAVPMLGAEGFRSVYTLTGTEDVVIRREGTTPRDSSALPS